MPTNLAASETRAVSIDAPPGTVIEYLADPHQLPLWAPDFAESVRADGDQWVISSGGGEARILVRVDREHGTVDLLAAAEPRIGAFSRVVPNRDGSEFLFTLLFGAGTPEADIERQMATVERELQTVREHCERVHRERRD
jgi:uncharacterized protein YndB with AHSA1/START domain